MEITKKQDNEFRTYIAERCRQRGSIRKLSFLDREYLLAYLRDDKKTLTLLKKAGAKIRVKLQRPILRTGAAFSGKDDYKRVCIKVTKTMVRQMLEDDAVWRSIGKKPA